MKKLEPETIERIKKALVPGNHGYPVWGESGYY